MKKPIITMLGTGSALVSRCFNTCFVLQSLDGTRLLVDTGGGNGILTQLRLAGIDRGDISHLFITHAHTDHILGAIWLIRMTLQRDRPSNSISIVTNALSVCSISFVSRCCPRNRPTRCPTVLSSTSFWTAIVFRWAICSCNVSTSTPPKKSSLASLSSFPMDKSSSVWATSPIMRLAAPTP